MRRIQKDYLAPPSFLYDKAAEQQKQGAITTRKGNTYTSYSHKTVRDKLTDKLLYGNKCAYCEQCCEDLEIEHYRPKDGGYYWLGNEWSNLLIACSKCNKKKGAKFPTIHRQYVPLESDNLNYAILPTDKRLLYELPLILNPELFDSDGEPTLHFGFDKDAVIYGKTLEGIFTINVCQLNRDWLVKERKKLLDTLFKQLEEACLMWEVNNLTDKGIKEVIIKTFNQICNAQEKDNPFSLWGKYLFENFEICFISRLALRYQSGIKIAFQKYQNGLLTSNN